MKRLYFYFKWKGYKTFARIAHHNNVKIRPISKVMMLRFLCSFGFFGHVCFKTTVAGFGSILGDGLFHAIPSFLEALVGSFTDP